MSYISPKTSSYVCYAYLDNDQQLVALIN